MSNIEDILINERVIKALEPLGIQVIYGDIINRKHDKYIMFSVYNEEDTIKVDNTNLGEKTYITMNYWYSNPNDLGLYKKIKKLMKENGFKFDGSKDLKQDGSYRGKNMDFEYEELL